MRRTEQDYEIVGKTAVRLQEGREGVTADEKCSSDRGKGRSMLQTE